jgi:hypothetical protein
MLTLPPQVRRPRPLQTNDTSRCGPGYSEGDITHNIARFSHLDSLCGPLVSLEQGGMGVGVAGCRALSFSQESAAVVLCLLY